MVDDLKNRDKFPESGHIFNEIPGCIRVMPGSTILGPEPGSALGTWGPGTPKSVHPLDRSFTDLSAVQHFADLTVNFSIVVSCNITEGSISYT